MNEPQCSPAQGPYWVDPDELKEIRAPNPDDPHQPWLLACMEPGIYRGERPDTVHASAHLLAASWEMRKVLEGLEWSEYDPESEVTFCPSCRASQHRGHAPTCPLALALAHSRSKRLQEHEG